MIAGKAIAEAKMSAVIIRADGRREDLGIVAYYNKNPLKQFAFEVSQLIKKLGEDHGHKGS